MNKRLFSILNEAATKYYQFLIGSDDDRSAIDYLHKLNISEETITTFRLGYAATAEKGLLDHLKSLDYSDVQIIEAGLAKRMRMIKQRMFFKTD